MDLSPRFSKMENYDVNKWQVWIREAFHTGGKTYQTYNSLPPCQEIDISRHKLCQNDSCASKYPISVAAILKLRLRDHVTPNFQPTPISDPGPQSSWASQTCLPRPGPNHKVQGLKPYNFAPNHTIFQWNHTILCQTIQFPDHVKILKIYASIHFEQELRIYKLHCLMP